MKTALVLFVTLGLIFLALKADAGRLISEEGHDHQAKQLHSDANLNNKAAFGGYNDVKKSSNSGDAVEVMSSDDDSGQQEGDDSHRYFPDVIPHPKAKEPEHHG